MSTPSNDPGDSMENMPAVRARVPEHVARGEISTGVIVVTGGTEFVLDFVRNLPRPSTIVARVVLPHLVMPQFIDALAKNIELFRQRYGELPGSQLPSNPLAAPASAAEPSIPQGESGALPAAAKEPSGFPPEVPGTTSIQAGLHSNPTPSPVPTPAATPKRQNPQEIYDELKLRDEILSGTYANAVMIGHGAYEFSFDFITNFYPQSAVSCRVYLASGHIARLLDSLKQSWEQLRPRLGYPPNNL
ncbi:MAG: DUF3467 domain-containing protein [Planctomycetota bacterium]|jgi:hypothetical protein